MPQWLQQIVAFSRNFGWLIVDTLRNFLSSADTTATVYFNSLQQFCCCNTMPFAAGFWQDSANLFLQFRANQLFMPTRIVLLWKKIFQARKKGKLLLNAQKNYKNLSRCFNLRKHSSPNKGPSSLKETGSNSPDSPAHILYILHYKAVILSKRLYKVTS